ncbi:MAG: hypothetical protein Kow0040_16880 [Thermogutta sp.]
MNIVLEAPEIEAPPGVSQGGRGRIVHVRSRGEAERFAPAWDALTGNHPFRSRAWNLHWWDVYGRESPRSRSLELCILVWLDDHDQVRALAPWYLHRHPLWGRLVRFLGEHEVCGDYLGLLCRPGDEAATARRFAEYLLGRRLPVDHAASQDGLFRESGFRLADSPCPQWDVLELTGVEVSEPTVRYLVETLRQAGCLVDHRPALSGWRIDLPQDWPDYLAGLTANARRRFRRLERQYFHDPRLRLHRVTSQDELREGFSVLERLHQALWNSRGQPGCFASARFREFHLRFARDMLAQDRLNMVWLEWEGRPIVAEYQFLADGTLYTYQSGMDPQWKHLSPGNLGNLLCIEDAIRRGCRHYDFCRGDEPYKAYLGAQPRPMGEWRIAAPRVVPRLRLRLWQWAKSARKFARQLAERRTSRDSSPVPDGDDTPRAASAPGDSDGTPLPPE